MDMVSKMVEPHRRQRDWDEKLQLAMLAYRSTPQASTGESPNMLMLGRQVGMPVDRIIEAPGQQTEFKTDYALGLRDRLQEAHERARHCLRRSALGQKTQYDKKAKGHTVKKGDFVWLSKKAVKKGLSPKLSMRWEGPFLVINQLSDVIFRIQRNGPRGTKKVVHYDRLKLYCGKPLQSWLPAVTQPDTVQEIPMVLPAIVDREPDQAEELVPESENNVDNHVTE